MTKSAEKMYCASINQSKSSLLTLPSNQIMQIAVRISIMHNLNLPLVVQFTKLNDKCTLTVNKIPWSLDICNLCAVEIPSRHADLNSIEWGSNLIFFLSSSSTSHETYSISCQKAFSWSFFTFHLESFQSWTHPNGLKGRVRADGSREIVK